MANIGNPEFAEFRVTLTNLLSTDNDLRNNAEERYETITTDKKVFLLLTAVGTDGLSQEVVELAAILLRRVFTTQGEGWFSKLPPEAQAQIKNQILFLLQQNINHSLRKRIGDAASELARNCLDDDGNNHWPEFSKFLFDAACSSDPVLKEIALLMFADVPLLLGNEQDQYLNVINQMLSASLNDQSSVDVRFAAMKATSSFMSANENEDDILKQFSTCIGQMIQLVAQSLDDRDKHSDELLGHLIDLVGVCPNSFRSYLDPLFVVCLAVIPNTGFPESTRQLALEVLVALAESNPCMIRKNSAKHIPDLVASVLKMMVEIEDEPDWDTEEEDVDVENDSTNIIGEAALDRLACALGGKTVLPIVESLLPLLLNNVEDWKQRYAALMAISAVGEGCHKQMSSKLGQIIDTVHPFLADPHSRVRYAACNALGQMSTDFAPVLQKKFGSKVLGGLLQLMSDNSSPRVQAHAGAAMVNFFEDCPTSVLSPCMNKAVNTLEAILKSKLNELAATGTKHVLEQIVITTAALAESAGERFKEHYERFMPCLKFILENAHHPDCSLLRGKTVECISLIGVAVGKEKFMTDAEEVMNLFLRIQACETPTADDPLLSYLISAWARICKVLGKDFEPYLPRVMQPVLLAASMKPEIALVDEDDLRDVDSKEESWEFVNLVGKQNFGIRTDGLEDKASACQMLVCYAKELKETFAPYVEETVKLMVPLLKFYFHDGVRAAAADIMPYLLESAKVNGDAYVKEMWKFIIMPFIQAIEYEPESDVLCNELEAFTKCIDFMGHNCLRAEELMSLTTCLNKRLNEHFEKEKKRDKKRNEEDFDESYEEMLEQEDEEDGFALSKIADVVSALLRIYKQEFFPYFEALVPQFVKLLEPNKSSADRLWSICVFADFIEQAGPACLRYEQYFVQPMLNSLSHPNADLRQTAAYAFGILAQYGGSACNKIVEDSLPALIKMACAPDARDEENCRASENAISTIGKFLMYSSANINKQEILPLWFSWLPIWEDKDEAKFCMNYLCILLETSNQMLLGQDNCNVPRFVQIIADAFCKDAIEPSSDVGKRALNFIRAIQVNAELFAMCLTVLNQMQREALYNAMLQTHSP